MTNAIASASATTSRCQRCGTKLRNQRKECPCCGLEVGADLAKVAESEAAAANTGGAARKPVAAKKGVKLCQVCMSSVADTEIQEVMGQKVCANCANMMNSKGKGGASPYTPPVAPTPSPAPVINTPAPAGATSSPAPASTNKSFAYQEEALKKQLFWPKVVIILNALVFLGSGALLWVALSLVGAVNNSIDPNDFDFDETEGASVEERRANIAKIKENVASETTKLKLLAFLSFFAAGALFVMFFFTNKYPFEICIAACSLYLLDFLISLAMGEVPGLIGIFIKVSIVASFVKAIQAGKEIKKLRAEKASLA